MQPLTNGVHYMSGHDHPGKPLMEANGLQFLIQNALCEPPFSGTLLRIGRKRIIAEEPFRAEEFCRLPELTWNISPITMLSGIDAWIAGSTIFPFLNLFYSWTQYCPAARGNITREYYEGKCRTKDWIRISTGNGNKAGFQNFYGKTLLKLILKVYPKFSKIEKIFIY